jgi:transmembrane sensor
MQDKQIEELIKKYQAGDATHEEIAFLESWYLNHNEADKAILHPDGLLEDAADVWSRLHPAKRSANYSSIWPWLAAAACLVLFFYFGSQFISTASNKKEQLTQHKTHAILPGSSKAILTLANGRKIILTDSGNSNFGKQGNTSISKTANGQLVYKVIIPLLPQWVDNTGLFFLMAPGSF